MCSCVQALETLWFCHMRSKCVSIDGKIDSVNGKETF